MYSYFKTLLIINVFLVKVFFAKWTCGNGTLSKWINDRIVCPTNLGMLTTRNPE